MKNYVVGIDLGGTKISCALADLEGNVKAQHTTPTNAHEGEQAVLDRIKVVNQLTPKLELLIN